MNASNQNVWPHVVISAIILAFCAFLVWKSPSSLETAILMSGAIAGWWIPAPGSSGGNLLTSSSTVTTLVQQLMHAITAFALPVPAAAQVAPAQLAPTQETDVTASMKAVTPAKESA
jgi:hypothetical protein